MIIGITGKLSGGKTNFAIVYCYEKLKEGKRLITNVYTDFKEYKDKVFYMRNRDFIFFLKKNYENQDVLKETFYNSVLFLDEIGFLVDARSTSNLNSLITGFMMMAGKLNCDVIYTAQIQESQTDLRLREITNVLANCYRVDITGKPLIFADRKVKQEIMIVVVMEFDFDIKGKKIVQFSYNPVPYYELYNTEEITILDRSQFMAGGVNDLKKF